MNGEPEAGRTFTTIPAPTDPPPTQAIAHRIREKLEALKVILSTTGNLVTKLAMRLHGRDFSNPTNAIDVGDLSGLFEVQEDHLNNLQIQAEETYNRLTEIMSHMDGED